MNDEHKLLFPISEEAPTGEDLRLAHGDSTFSRVREIMRDDDLDPNGEERSTDWKGLIGECDKALSERTKDLELAAYLTLGWFSLSRGTFQEL